MIWIIEQRDLWGDYGCVLIRGFAKRDDGGELLLERTGPFLPPISFPFVSFEAGPVVSQQLCDALRHRFPMLQFRSVRKHRIVRLDWHTWPLDAERPRQFPEEGEPEYYIWKGISDPGLATSMPDVWEISGPQVEGRLRRIEDPRGGYLDRFSGWISAFHDEVALCGQRLVIVDSPKEWFSKEVGDWIKFCPVDSVETTSGA